MVTDTKETKRRHVAVIEHGPCRYSVHRIWQVQRAQNLADTACTESGRYSVHRIWQVQRAQNLAGTACTESGRYSVHRIWQMFTVPQNLEDICDSSESGRYLRYFRIWRIFAILQNLVDVCDISESGAYL